MFDRGRNVCGSPIGCPYFWDSLFSVFCRTEEKGYLCEEIMQFIGSYIPQIKILCQKHNVNKLFAFGSVLTNRFNEQSDIDLIVSFDKQNIADYFDNYFDFKYSLEDIFGRKVDLLEDKPIKNKYLRESIEHSKQLIYG